MTGCEGEQRQRHHEEPGESLGRIHGTFLHQRTVTTPAMAPTPDGRCDTSGAEPECRGGCGELERSANPADTHGRAITDVSDAGSALLTL